MTSGGDNEIVLQTVFMISVMILWVLAGLLQIDPPHKWNLSHTLVNKGTLLERELAKIIDVKKKRNSK